MAKHGAWRVGVKGAKLAVCLVNGNHVDGLSRSTGNILSDNSRNRPFRPDSRDRWGEIGALLDNAG